MRLPIDLEVTSSSTPMETHTDRDDSGRLLVAAVVVIGVELGAATFGAIAAAEVAESGTFTAQESSSIAVVAVEGISTAIVAAAPISLATVVIAARAGTGITIAVVAILGRSVAD